MIRLRIISMTKLVDADWFRGVQLIISFIVLLQHMQLPIFLIKMVEGISTNGTILEELKQNYCLK